MHRRQWVCEEHNKEKFPTKDLFVDHVNKFHLSAVASHRLPLLIEMSERQIDEMETTRCPLCPEARELKILENHLAEHLESISLFVLPTEFEEDEQANKKEDDKGSHYAAGGSPSSGQLESELSDEKSAGRNESQGEEER